MVVLKILVLFLLVDLRERVHCQTEDYNYDDYTEQNSQEHPHSTKVVADNELTHVRTKNLSGNVKLTTLQVLTTNTPFDKLNNEFENEEEDILDRTTGAEPSENKQILANTITENQQKVSSLSDLGTKGPTDVIGPPDLMDVFNSTSGTLPDHVGTEQLISVTPLNFQLIHQEYNLTTAAEKFVAEITNFENEEKTNDTQLEKILDSGNLENRKNAKEVDNIGVGTARSTVPDNQNEIMPVTQRSEFARKLIITPTPKIIDLLPTDKIETQDSISEIKTENINEMVVSSTLKPTVENAYDSFTTNQNEGLNSRFDEVFTTLFPSNKLHREEDSSQKENNVLIEINNFDEYKSSVEKTTENFEDIEDLSSFFTIDEEILNTVTDEIENNDTSSEIIDDVSSILNKFEDFSHRVNEISTQTSFSETATTASDFTNISTIQESTLYSNMDNDDYVTEKTVTSVTTTAGRYITSNTMMNDRTETKVYFPTFFNTINGALDTTTVGIYATSNATTFTDFGSTQSDIYYPASSDTTNRIYDTTTQLMYPTFNTISTSTSTDLTTQTNNIYSKLDTTTIQADTASNTLSTSTFADFTPTETSIFGASYETQTSETKVIDTTLPLVLNDDLVRELQTTSTTKDNYTPSTLSTIYSTQTNTFVTEESKLEPDTTFNSRNPSTFSNYDTITESATSFSTADRISETTTAGDFVATKRSSEGTSTYDTTIVSSTSKVITAEPSVNDASTTSNLFKTTTDETSTTVDITKTSEASVNSDTTVSNVDFNQFSTTISVDESQVLNSTDVFVRKLDNSNEDPNDTIKFVDTKKLDANETKIPETSEYYPSTIPTTDDESTIFNTTDDTFVNADTTKTSTEIITTNEAFVSFITTIRNVDSNDSTSIVDLENKNQTFTSTEELYDKSADLTDNELTDTESYANTKEIEDNQNATNEKSKTSYPELGVNEVDKSSINNESTTLAAAYQNLTGVVKEHDVKVSSVADSLVTLFPPRDEKIENVTEPHILCLIFNGKHIFCTIKIIDNDQSFYIPPNATFKKLQNGFDLFWNSAIDQSNNSLQVLQLGSLLQFSLFISNTTYVHNITSNSSLKDDNRNLTVNFGSGVSISFSNSEILHEIRQDSKAASVLSSVSEEATTLNTIITAGCLGVAVVVVVAIYWTMKKFRSRKQNYNPNGIP